ncbi:MAG: rhodanese-like domain-containing protein [Flavobacteriales bacterium]|jgi:rhodanese-related sulfurtransferase
MKEISPSELHSWKNEGKAYQLIDVREEHEVAYCSIGGEHIPMEQIISNLERIREDVPVIFHCQSGRRSEAVVYWIEQKFNRDNLYTLKGGIAAYGQDIDSSLECFK